MGSVHFYATLAVFVRVNARITDSLLCSVHIEHYGYYIAFCRAKTFTNK